MIPSTQPLSPLRQRMLEDMRMRKLEPRTQEAYIRAVRKLAAYLKRSPDAATVEDLRNFQLHLVDTGSSPMTLNATLTGLKFFFDITLGRIELMAKMQPVKLPRTLPVVLSCEEVSRLLAAARNIKHQVALPVRVGDLDVAHVRGQRQHPLIKVRPLFMPQDQAPHGKAVANVVDPRLSMPAAIHPVQLPSQLLKHSVGLPVAQRLAPTHAARTDEERRVKARTHMLPAQRPVGRQWSDCAGMQAYLARLAELGLPNGQERGVQVHVSVIQVERFRDPQTGRGKQPEQRRIGGGTKAIGRTELAGSVEQRDHLCFAVDVRGNTARESPDAGVIWDFGGWLELS